MLEHAHGAGFESDEEIGVAIFRVRGIGMLIDGFADGERRQFIEQPRLFDDGRDGAVGEHDVLHAGDVADGLKQLFQRGHVGFELRALLVQE